MTARAVGAIGRLHGRVGDDRDGIVGGLHEHQHAVVEGGTVLDPGKRGRAYSKGNRVKVALIAALASHDKKATDAQFEAFLPLITRAAADERNFVKKAVNWALRGIGKRNLHLNACAVDTATQLQTSASRSAGAWSRTRHVSSTERPSENSAMLAGCKSVVNEASWISSPEVRLWSVTRTGTSPIGSSVR